MFQCTFRKKDKNKTVVQVKITRKAYSMNTLKTNMFIENNVLEFEKFDIFTFTSSVYIENCEIIISIFIKNRFVLQTISVYLTKASIISFRSEINICIYKISLLECDYFFEFAEITFAIYFHVVNINIVVISIRNNDNKSIKVFRDF